MWEKYRKVIGKPSESLRKIRVSDEENTGRSRQAMGSRDPPRFCQMAGQLSRRCKELTKVRSFPLDKTLDLVDLVALPSQSCVFRTHLRRLLMSFKASWVSLGLHLRCTCALPNRFDEKGLQWIKWNQVSQVWQLHATWPSRLAHTRSPSTALQMCEAQRGIDTESFGPLHLSFDVFQRRHPVCTLCLQQKHIPKRTQRRSMVRAFAWFPGQVTLVLAQTGVCRGKTVTPHHSVHIYTQQDMIIDKWWHRSRSMFGAAIRFIDSTGHGVERSSIFPGGWDCFNFQCGVSVLAGFQLGRSMFWNIF